MALPTGGRQPTAGGARAGRGRAWSSLRRESSRDTRTAASSRGTPTTSTRIGRKDLKAVFFVREFAGDPRYNERKRFGEAELPPGRKVEVTFWDGEVLVGSTTGYAPDRAGFFFAPADPRSNNLRVFAVSAAVRDLRYL